MIPTKLNNQMNDDPFYRKCCMADKNCDGKIERHHNLIYGGKQQNYLFCILPACANYHHKFEKRQDIRDKLDWIMLNRTNLEFLIKTFPRRNWLQLLNYLYKKYELPIRKLP